MSAFVLFLVGIGVGSAVMWLLQMWHTAPGEPAHPRRERDRECWSVQRITARIEQEERIAPRTGHHARAVSPAAGTRPTTSWAVVASAS